MTDHLPECFASLCECDDTHFKSIDCDFSCICPSLRACEQRVSSEFLTPMALASTGMSDPRYAKGYADGLDAAREAASALDEGPKNRLYWIDRENALIAIDELWRGVIFAAMVAVPIIVLVFWLFACVLIPIID